MEVNVFYFQENILTYTPLKARISNLKCTYNFNAPNFEQAKKFVSGNYTFFITKES